ncbi:helix-turn-helix domain-containing protein [Lentzea nigeriaca]|uniref:helix-turn-helix domain-containing protein n=1 Tax=Lentzea nigeriaca TaxID=1128665 RepID=UPI00195CDB8A|nr:PucR family transcriptional regulator ligand-binding domain-containing protein [Lentzea nigeriaca]MBM7857350.1 purine catabolism regulator [Lentzea nigeriaca]
MATLPTIQQILDLEDVRRGEPVVLAGAGNLGRAVCWVHVADRPRPGELQLVVDGALPLDGARWLEGTAATGVAGVVVGCATALPDAVVHAAQRLGLPLVRLRREIQVSRVTEAVLALVAEGRLAESRRCEEIHRRFTELARAGADALTVVSHAAAMAKCPVVLENTAHQVIAFAPADADPQLIDDWESLSRRIIVTGQTGHDGTGWLVSSVGAAPMEWGRLLVRCPEPAVAQVVIAERAADVIARDLLAHKDEDSRSRAHHALLTALSTGELLSAEFAARARALGVPVDQSVLVAVVIRTRSPGDLADRIRDLLQDLVCLHAALDGGSLGVLLALRPDDDVHGHLVRLAEAVRRRAPVIVAASEPVTSEQDARKALVEAQQVAAAASGGRWDAPYVKLRDLGLHGLMYLLRDDPRIQAHVERELGPLLRPEHTGLISTLRSYVDSGGNKTDAAATTNLSRQALYDRLKRVSQLLDADLDSPRVRASLHAALCAHDAIGLS